MWLVLLFVMVGIVVVVLILTISKMQAVSSTSLYGLRRFEGHFLVTEGPLLKFDGRFVPAVPALDVTFILKIRPNTNINILNLLSVLRNYVRAQGFDGNTIDDKSISLENKHP
uniref:Band 7 domain-containing protein n=1 Tax=Setaria digitata TaxID=48799 RepID=A0A915PMB4_9BILA